MPKLTLTDITSGYASTTQLNANFAAIETAIENTVSRNGTTPNTMSADLDMNGQSILNISSWVANTISADNLYINGTLVTPSSVATSVLPDPTGQDNKVLKSDNITASWETQTAEDVTFIQSGTGAVGSNVQTKLRETVSRADYDSDANYNTAKAALTGRLDHVVRTTPGTTDRLLSAKLGEMVSVTDFGAVGNGTVDDTAAIQAAFDSGAKDIYIPPGTYRCNSALNLVSNTRVYGVRGSSWLYQYGSTLFVGPNNLSQLVLSGLSFDLKAASINAYTTWASLKTHERCIFEDFYFIRYDEATILERFVHASDTLNCVFNTYQNWEITSCANICISAGYEANQYVHTGDGTANAINTGITWPEAFNSSVVILLENGATQRRQFSELTRGTDYTVSYPAGVLTITPTGVINASNKWRIYPSSPISTGRRPISNNVWRDIRNRFNVYQNGWVDLRWVDAESFQNCRLALGADGANGFFHNPYQTREGQAGDWAAYLDCTFSVSESGEVTDSETCRAFVFGPGSFSMTGRGIRLDGDWETGAGQLHTIRTVNKARVALPGTISTNGTSTVTTADMDFRDHFTLLGTADRIEIDGVIHGITAVNELTLTVTPAPAGTASGLTAHRVRFAGGVDYTMDFGGMGHLGTNLIPRVGTATTATATRNFDNGTVLNGATTAVVTHGVRRTPDLYEITITPGSVELDSWWITNRTATTFTLNVAVAVTGNRSFGWDVDLKSIN